MRTPIGFKVTDNKLAVIDEQEQKFNDVINEIDLERIRETLKIANEISKLMYKQATSIAKNRKFSITSGLNLPEYLDKLYIKHYEPL